MEGYFQIVTSLLAKPWEETSSLNSLDQSRAQTWETVSQDDTLVLLIVRGCWDEKRKMFYLGFCVDRVEHLSVVAVPNFDGSVRGSTSRGQDIGLPWTPRHSFDSGVVLTERVKANKKFKNAI